MCVFQERYPLTDKKYFQTDSAPITFHKQTKTTNSIEFFELLSIALLIKMRKTD